jgi:hypothetical protein
MTLGTGVFLSSLFLGLIFLYIVTRDRWKWKKIVFRSTALVVGLAIIGSAGFYAYTSYADRAQRAESLWAVSIGETESDVKFAKGEPSKISDSSANNDIRWLYEMEDVGHAVYFQGRKVTRVIALAKERRDLPSVSGISPHASLDDIINKLGPPSYVSRSKNELSRIYSFAKFNVAFGIEQGEIKSVAVGVTEEWPVRLVDEGGP